MSEADFILFKIVSPDGVILEFEVSRFLLQNLCCE